MANEERIELRLPLEEKERWVEQAKEFGLTLSEWVRRCCSHHATPEQRGSRTAHQISADLGRTWSYRCPRNVRKVVVWDNDLISMLRHVRYGLPRDMKVHGCQKDILDANFIISSSGFSLVPYGCSIPELWRL